METLSPPVPKHTDRWYGLLPATQNIGTHRLQECHIKAVVVDLSHRGDSYKMSHGGGNP